MKKIKVSKEFLGCIDKKIVEEKNLGSAITELYKLITSESVDCRSVKVSKSMHKWIGDALDRNFPDAGTDETVSWSMTQVQYGPGMWEQVPDDEIWYFDNSEERNMYDYVLRHKDRRYDRFQVVLKEEVGFKYSKVGNIVGKKIGKVIIFENEEYPGSTIENILAKVDDLGYSFKDISIRIIFTGSTVSVDGALLPVELWYPYLNQITSIEAEGPVVPVCAKCEGALSVDYAVCRQCTRYDEAKKQKEAMEFSIRPPATNFDIRVTREEAVRIMTDENIPFSCEVMCKELGENLVTETDEDGDAVEKGASWVGLNESDIGEEDSENEHPIKYIINDEYKTLELWISPSGGTDLEGHNKAVIDAYMYLGDLR